MKELISKYQITLQTVNEVIHTTDDEQTMLTAQAVKRFIEGFIFDLTLHKCPIEVKKIN